MRSRSISAIVAAAAIVAAVTVHARAADATWPPKGSAVRVPIVRDNWTSAVGDERYGNNGGSSRMKLKGQQEHSIFDIDPSALKGKIITGALWHVRSAGVREPLRRVTASTLASPWVEGTASRYDRQAGSSCFAQAELGKRDWSYPGSTLMDVAFGGGRTIWRFAEASPPADQGWQAVAIDPDVLAARIAGLSYGLAAYDDVGSEWAYRGGKFTYSTFPNRFIFSHEQSSSAPWLEVWVNGADSRPPPAVTDIAATTDGLPAGEALVTWTTPADTGGGKTLGFNVAFAAAGKPQTTKASGQVPRYLIPFAGPAGRQVRMHLAGLPLAPDAAVTLTIAAVDSAGNVGAAASKAIRLSAEPAAMELPDAGIEPFPPSTNLPAAGPLKVGIVDLLDKISPATGAMIPPQPQGYLGGNHLWSAAKKLIRLYAARNEAVCFQVNLAGSAKSARATLTFPASSPLGAPRAGVKAKVERFDYVQTSAGVLPDVIVPLPRGGRFAVPFADDPEATGAENVSLLCEVYVGHDAKPGLRRGTLRVEADGGALDIAVELNVWDFTLPDKLSFIPEMNCYGTAGPGTGLEYYRVAHEHRLCLNRLYYNWRGQPSQLPGLLTAAPGWAGGNFDWAAWDKAFGPLLDGSAFADLPRAGEPVDVFYLPFCENWPVPIEKNYLKTYWIDRAFRPGYRQELSNAFAQFASHCNQRKWRQTIFEFYLNNKVYFKRDGGWGRSSALWVFDEPVNTQDFWALRWYGAVWQQAVSASAGAAKMWFRADVSYSQYERDIFRDVLDIECLGGCDAQKVRMARERSLLGGGACHVQYGSANDPATANLQPVLWCLKAFADGSVGVLPWQTIGSADKLTKGAPTGLFIAAPGGGVVPSVRVKAFRRGQQDVEYLTMLGDVSGKPLFAVAGMLKKRIDLAEKVRKTSEADAGTVSFDKASSAALWRLRVAAGAAISAKHPPYRRCIRPITVPKRDPGGLDMPRYASPAPALPPSGPDM